MHNEHKLIDIFIGNYVTLSRFTLMIVKYLVLGTLLILTACQPTPEDSIVVQKDAEHMIEAAKTGQKEHVLPIAEQYDIPEHYECEMSELDGCLTLHVNADVVVPEVSAMPIVRVQETDFTQNQVSGIFNVLCGKAEMWNVSDGEELSKDEIEEMNLFIQKEISDLSSSQNQNADKLEVDKTQLEYLQSIYTNAPESKEATRCNGELSQKISRDIVSGNPLYTYTGMYAMSKDNQIEMYVANRSGDCKDNGSDGAPLSAAMSFLNHRRLALFDESDCRPISDMNVIPEDAQNSVLTITPAKAVDIANEFLATAGLSNDIAVDSVYYAINQSYYLCCVRRVGDAQGTYIEGVSYGDTTDQYAPFWEYEHINMLVDADGVYRFNWTAPVTVLETVTDNASLKSFDEVMEKYKDAVSYKYAAQLKDTGISREFNIDRITLSLQRISEQNALGYGLMVPAWNFYGTQQDTYLGDNGEKVNTSGILMTSMLSINAIDGSIIDIEKGY